MGMLTLRIDAETEEILAWLCKTTGHTKTYWVKRLLKAGIEDLYPTKEETEAINEYEKAKAAGKVSSTPLDEILKELLADAPDSPLPRPSQETTRQAR
jgi:predicted DNA-binding protein